MNEEPLLVGAADEEPWFEAAGRALRLAVEDHVEEALDLVEDIYQQWDWQGLQSSMQMWIDEVMRVRGIAPGTLIHPVWKHTDSEQVTAADETPPAARWAGWMLVARIGNDFDQWCALMDSMPGEPGQCVDAVLQICSLQIVRAGGGGEPDQA